VEKVKLPVESLDVDSFDLGAVPKYEGTVRGHATAEGGVCCTVDGTGCRTVVATHPCTSC